MLGISGCRKRGVRDSSRSGNCCDADERKIEELLGVGDHHHRRQRVRLGASALNRARTAVGAPLNAVTGYQRGNVHSMPNPCRGSFALTEICPPPRRQTRSPRENANRARAACPPRRTDPPAARASSAFITNTIARARRSPPADLDEDRSPCDVDDGRERRETPTTRSPTAMNGRCREQKVLRSVAEPSPTPGHSCEYTMTYKTSPSAATIDDPVRTSAGPRLYRFFRSPC